MPDPVLFAKAMGTAALLSAMVLWISAWPWKTPRASRVEVGSLIGLAVGFSAGCWILGTRLHWPPRQDLDRLLVLVLPTVFMVETAVQFAGVRPWLAWLPRLLVVAGTARVLLHGSSYLASSPGSATGGWPLVHTWVILGGLAGFQLILWVLLDLLAVRVPGTSETLCLAVTIAGAALAIMLSGYATGGQIGLPLAAAFGGIACASMTVSSPSRSRSLLGPAVVGLASLLMIGYFFGELTRPHFLLLLAVPLLAWVPEVPFLRHMPLWLHGVLRVLIIGLAVAGIVLHAQTRFAAASGPAAQPGIPGSSAQDYLDFGR
jgi:hypothetical protein